MADAATIDKKDATGADAGKTGAAAQDGGKGASAAGAAGAAGTQESLLGGAKAPDAKAQDGKDGQAAGGDGKAAGAPGKDGQQQTQTKDTQQKQGAPEKYADFTVPEGVTLSKELVEKASSLFKKHGLSQEAAQELVTFQAENELGQVKAREDHFRNVILKDWREQTIKLLGAEYQKELGHAARFLDRFGPPELRQWLTESGLGENPLLAKALVAAGKAMAEDKFVEGKGASAQDDEQARLRRRFPSMFNEDGSPKS